MNQEEIAPVAEKTWATLYPVQNSSASSFSYTVCGCDAPDRTQYKFMKEWLSIGILPARSARPVHNMFAALVYTIQLINLLTVHFDICIPGEISFQEFSSWRKWTESLFDTDIFKLNHAVVILCLSTGVDPALIDPLNPFANLLQLKNIVDNPNSVLKIGHGTLTNDLAAAFDKDLRQISWAERERAEEDGWYIVRHNDNFYDDSDDITMPLKLSASLKDLEEILRHFATISSRPISLHDFRYVLDDAKHDHPSQFLARISEMLKNLSTK
ncbi:unnamed protein product [Thelazia callipaeda]|uniref:Expressed conserved protein n=1 Tax=Thelazia callipaeda TaxID=103827 RepID=A0A0N5CPK7_THECL|nr:unnamed protein product [Thelazia callipaeda]